MLKAVIYDLDGTLIDSRADLAAAVNATLVELELPSLTREQLLPFVGGGAELLVRRSLAAARGAGERAADVPASLVAEAMPRWHASYSQHLLDETRCYPGVEELLAIPPHARAILTNKPGAYSRQILAGLNLAHAFAQVIGGDEAAKKPDPRGLLSLCENLHAAPEETLYVGDMVVDVDTAKAAGVPVCAVTWGFAPHAQLAAARPTHLASSAHELRELLERLSA